MGFPGGSVVRSTCQWRSCRDKILMPGLGQSPGEKETASVFLPEEITWTGAQQATQDGTADPWGGKSWTKLSN